MKSFLALAIGLYSAIGFTSSAGAITITLAEVQNGLAVVQGNKAAKSAIITWDGVSVTQTSKGGSFSFSGTVPADCVGTLSDGVSTVDVVVLDCTPVSAAPAPVPRTGQTTSYAAGDDGALQKGVAWPNPRFTDNNNGTITDNLTGLIWLKDVSCLGSQTWAIALATANALADGNIACGLLDGSVTGDWRLPNRNELLSLLDLGRSRPSFPAGNPFVNNIGDGYWSSTTFADNTNLAWRVDWSTSFVQAANKLESGPFTAVRGGS